MVFAKTALINAKRHRWAVDLAAPICSVFVLISESPMSEHALRKAQAAQALEQEVDQAIEACGGDIRAALRAALIANSFLLEEIERLTRAVSVGFTRRQSPSRKASEMLDRWREISAGQLPGVE
jgi:hypothetical protein